MKFSQIVYNINKLILDVEKYFHNGVKNYFFRNFVNFGAL